MRKQGWQEPDPNLTVPAQSPAADTAAANSQEAIPQALPEQPLQPEASPAPSDKFPANHLSTVAGPTNPQNSSCTTPEEIDPAQDQKPDTDIDK